MKKVNPVAAQQCRNRGLQKLTIGLDLGDRSSWYCVLDETGSVLLEQRLSTTPKALRERFGGMPASRIALETGTHSPWVSRLLSELGHEVIVAHAPQRAADLREPAQRRSSGCADFGAAGEDRSRVAVSGEASQPASASGSGGDSCSGWSGTGPHGAGERGARTGQELWRTLARLQRAQPESGESPSLSPELQSALEPLLAEIVSLSARIAEYTQVNARGIGNSVESS